jgi:hypothetical protein
MSATEKVVGGGLVDISAVVTLIGAPTAEALIHGLKAACGMCWAPMSTFGSLHVTKACLSASIPDWLREPMGLKNQFVDAAIGVMLTVNHTKQAKNRVDLGDAIAIQVATPKGEGYTNAVGYARGASGGEKMMSSTAGREGKRKTSVQVERGIDEVYFEHHSRWMATSGSMCIYTLDRNSQLALDTVPPTERGEAVKIHRFMPDIDGIVPAWKDWVVLFASLGKVAEAMALRKLGSHRLWYWTMSGWVHAFCSAVLLQLLNIGRDNPLRASSDIAAGVLPNPLHLGGSGKIVLGMPANVRRLRVWRVLLGLGTIFNLAGVFGTFIFLGQEPSIVLYFWLSFQILWLGARSVVYYFTEGAAAARQGVTSCKSWEESPDEDRSRVMTLLGAMSKHQVSIHPRGVQAYRRDCLSFQELCSLFSRAAWTLTPSLAAETLHPKTRNLDVRASAGDPLMRSAVWFTGANLSNADLYDVCVAFIFASNDPMGEAETDVALTAVPCVRVYACNCLRDSLPRQRGNAHADCGKLEWLYFIPTTTSINPVDSASDTEIEGQKEGGVKHSWTFAHGPVGVGFLPTEPMTDDELHQRLARGRWRISLQSIGELNAALEVSRGAVRLVMNMLRRHYS